MQETELFQNDELFETAKNDSHIKSKSFESFVEISLE